MLPTRYLTALIRLEMYVHKVDFPDPVGIQIHPQIKTGSFQSVLVTFTEEAERKNPWTLNKEVMTAVGGMLRAFPICAHP